MRVVKKFYSADERTTHVSRVFDSVISTTELPLSFDVLEFSFGYGATKVDHNKAVLGIDIEDPLLDERDERLTRTIINFELFRAVTRKRLDKNVPRLVEDVLVGRDMIRNGHVEDLVYLFYVFMLKHRITDAKNFIRFNVPWLIFSGHDEFYAELFKNLAKDRVRFTHKIKTRSLFEALKKDLWDEDNMERAVKCYEAVLHAGNKI